MSRAPNKDAAAGGKPLDNAAPKLSITGKLSTNSRITCPPHDLDGHQNHNFSLVVVPFLVIALCFFAYFCFDFVFLITLRAV